MGSPTQRSLAYLKKNGYMAQVVEKWNAYAKPFGKRVDLFGVIDIIAVPLADRGILGVQATSDSNMTSRTQKALAEDRLKRWLLAGGMFEIWTWGKKGPRGEVKRWCLRRRRFHVIPDKRGAKVVFTDVK